MEKIKEYCLLLMTLMILSGMMLVLSPEGGIRKYIKYVCSLCLCVAFIVPVSSVLYDLPGIQERDGKDRMTNKTNEVTSDLNDRIISEAAANLKESLCRYLCDTFGFSPDDLKIEIELDKEDPGDIRICAIDVTVPDTRKSEAVKEKLDDLFLHRTVIRITAIGKGETQ